MSHAPETAPQSAPRRPALGLELAASGTRLAACLPTVAPDRRWHARLSAPPTPEDAVKALAALTAEALRDAGVEHPASAGVAVWGRVEVRAGAVTRLGATSAWDGFPLGTALASTLGVPVAVASATMSAAVAEAAAAGAPADQRVLYVHIGREITSALLLAGAVEGGEGLLGHLRVREGGPRCSCGLTGHLEPLASAQALVRRMIGLASDSEESHAAMQRISGGRAEAMTAAQVVALAEQGDAIAARVVADALDALAVALANVTALAMPNLAILGGPLVEAGEGFLQRLRDRLTTNTLPFVRPPQLRWGALEPYAALLGAARMAEMA